MFKKPSVEYGLLIPSVQRTDLSYMMVPYKGKTSITK
jgi:hypothetical protein